ncbi:MAG: phosphoribosylaminoimidazolecarboxamide formyltransferase [Firmicutes bacterium]|nr:phosphoribosylaminoimidazolecarboxamide formyltransferase [Bacillota bacterium]
MMKEMQLKYGCNPNQKGARIFMAEGGQLPLTILNGQPGYINLLDALNAYQLVRELAEATGMPAAASFKHVSPAGAAIALPLRKVDRAMYFVAGEDLSPQATAYVRARGADRMSSFGDFIALSGTCDVSTARLIAREVSDGIIAPAYEEEALKILRAKRRGSYIVIKMARDYQPAPLERRQVYGITFEQERNEVRITPDQLQNVVTRERELPQAAVRDLLLALITLKYTQSNSVCYVQDGQTIGVGAGQQSRIHCTRLAGDKADVFQLRRHPKVLALPFKEGLGRAERDNAVDLYLSRAGADLLADGVWQDLFSRRPQPLTEEEKTDFLGQVTGVSLGSDAFFPFADNIERAAKSGVRYIAQPGGSIRDDLVIEACNRHGMVMALTGIRLFHH